MVPPNWEHPKKQVLNFRKGTVEWQYQPMYDSSYIERMDEWIANYQLWKEGKHHDQLNGSAAGHARYAEWAGDPPQHEYYRPEWTKEERTWFQVYETVSEGTPVTPPFATREELVEYLVQNGDFWDQQRRAEGDSIMNCAPWTREAAERFVMGSGWAPSLIMSGGKVMSGVEGLAEAAKPTTSRRWPKRPGCTERCGGRRRWGGPRLVTSVGLSGEGCTHY